MKQLNRVNFEKDKFLMFVMDKMAFELEKSHNDVIRLTLGKSELPLHSDIIQVMVDALNSFEKYSQVFPEGVPELKDELTSFYKSKSKVDIRPDNIIIGAGTSALFRNIFYSLLNEGDEVLIPRPYYPLYKISALLAGVNIRYYKIDMHTMQVDMESFKEQFTDKVKIVVVNSPGNPIGNILTKEELMEIDDIVNGKAVIISDEIYENMSFDQKAPSVIDIFNNGSGIRGKSQFIITNSFSKAYRMYSRRVGWCVIPDWLIIPLTTIQHHTLLTVDPVEQLAGIEALKHPEELVIIRELYKKRRDYTIEKFKDNQNVRVIPAKGSFYCTLDCSLNMKNKNTANDFELAKKILEKTHVATVPGTDFGIPAALRLSYTSNKYNEGIDRLYKFFEIT